MPLLDHDRIVLNAKPTRPIVRLMNKQHVRSFFKDGVLRLGSFATYQLDDHKEIGDPAEGQHILVAEQPTETATVRATGGYNFHVMCCTLAATPGLATRFGYDSGFVIDNPVAFAAAITKTLNSSDPYPAVRSQQGACYYHDGAIWSRLRFFDFDSPKHSHNISLRALGRANSRAKYFVKSHRFAHQCEYRFIWEMPDDVTKATLIECPEARYYCREL